MGTSFLLAYVKVTLNSYQAADHSDRRIDQPNSRKSVLGEF